MEIKVKCNKNIELSNFEKLKVVRSEILSTNLSGDTLTGDVKISGEYFKKNSNESKKFEDIVPFTVVFRSSNIKIDEVEVENEKFNINEGIGLEITFDLVVEYEVIEKYEDEEDIKIPVEYDDVEQVFSNIEYDEDEEVINHLAQEVTEGHNQIIKELLDNRDDFNFEVNYNNKENKVNLNRIPYKHKKVSVYYFEKESDIEKIAKERKVSVQEIYNKNSDNIQKRRIIIDE